MKDTLTSLNHQDFKARYQGTFGWLILLDAPRRLVQVLTVSRDAVHFVEQGTLTFHVLCDSGVFFEFIPVDKGWFLGVDGNLKLLTRHPARQWKRGIHPDNTQVFSPETFPYTSDHVSYDVLFNLFKPGHKAHGVKTAPPFAISQYFAVDNQNRVWLYDKRIGGYTNGVITLESEMFQQELQDQLRRQNSDIRVVV